MKKYLCLGALYFAVLGVFVGLMCLIIGNDAAMAISLAVAFVMLLVFERLERTLNW